jgi:hypothetical protein
MNKTENKKNDNSSGSGSGSGVGSLFGFGFDLYGSGNQLCSGHGNGNMIAGSFFNGYGEPFFESGSGTDDYTGFGNGSRIEEKNKSGLCDVYDQSID